jgi:Mg-chelatase subunit ChlD
MSYILVADFLDGVTEAARHTIKAAGLQVNDLRCGIGTSNTASIQFSRQVYGHKTYVDCVIYFPRTLDLLGRMPQALADMWAAYWLHEIAHALYTDDAAAKPAHNGGYFFELNALEDIRIESRLIAKGVAANGKALLEKLARSKLEESRAGGALDPMSGFASYLCYAGREKNLGYDLDLIAECAPYIPAHAAQFADQVWARVAAAKSTADLLPVAKDVHDFVKALNKAQRQGDTDQGQPGKGQPKPGKGQGKGEGEGQQGQQGEGKGEGKGEGQSEGQQGQGQGEGEGKGQGQGEAQQGQGEGQGQGQQGEGKGQSEAQKGEGDIAQGKGAGGGAVAMMPNPDLQPGLSGDASLDAGQSNGALVDNKIEALAQARRSRVRKITPQGVTNKGSVARRDDLPLSSRLDRDIAELVKAPARDARKVHQDRGRLSRRDTARIVRGARDVFALRDVTPARNTAVMVILDQSGSMSGRAMEESAKACRMIVRAIERCGGLVSVAGFFESGAAVDLRIVKPFGKRAIACAMGPATEIGGGTPMSPAIVLAARHMAEQRDATRRLLIVLTDGGCNLGPEAVKFACAYAGKLGVETAAIGIGFDPGPAFPARFAAADLASLGRDGLGNLLKLIRAEKVAA